ncbi:MAG: hypothetical protein RI906_514 [Pseudomonadota bacterium]
MIEIQAPDNTIVRFPDGTPDEVIKDVMQREYGTPVEKERRRTVLHGLTLGAYDEMEAAARSAATSIASKLGFDVNNPSYEEVLKEIRGNLKAYQEAYPVSSLGYEAAGAAIPAVASLIAAPFTGGSSTAVTAPSLARLAALAGLEGGVYAFNTGEGGFGERASRVPGGVVTGTFGGTLAGGATRAAGGALNAITGTARRILGNRGSSIVENEIQRLAEQTGKTADEIADDIINGRIMAENETIQAAVRAYRASGGKASTIIMEAMKPRPAQTRAQAMDEMRKYLSDVNAPSALQAQRRDEEAVAAARRAAYAPFKNIEAPDEVSREVLSALEVVPEAIGEVNKMFRGLVATTPPASGIGPANVTFTRPITMDEAERVRRAIKNSATAEYRAGYGGAGESFSAAEKWLRGAIDAASPELGAVRAQVAKIEGQNRAFEAGQTALAGDVNEKLFAFSKITDPDQIEAYRAGLMATLEARATTGSRQSMIRNLTNPETKEGMMIREVLPQDAVDDVLNKLETARSSQATTDFILRGSPTEETKMEAARRGMGVSVADLTGVLRANPDAVIRIASNLAAKFTRDLTDAERARVARNLVSEDPYLVRRAISDEGAMAALQTRIQELTAAGTKGAARAGTVTGAQPGATISQQALRSLLAGGEDFARGGDVKLQKPASGPLASISQGLKQSAMRSAPLQAMARGQRRML